MSTTGAIKGNARSLDYSSNCQQKAFGSFKMDQRKRPRALNSSRCYSPLIKGLSVQVKQP